MYSLELAKIPALLASTYGQCTYGSGTFNNSCAAAVSQPIKIGPIPITGSTGWIILAIAALSLSLGLWVWTRQRKKQRLNQAVV